MTAKFEVINGDIKITFTYQAASEKIVEAIDAAAHYLWNLGKRPVGAEEFLAWDDATNQQKLNMVDVGIRERIIYTAKEYARTSAAQAALDAANYTV